jgi:protein-tyrosine phosphatase
MIDIHCHILPNLDDGPASLGESLAMCRAAAGDGIRIIVAAPHFKPGTYEFTRPEILGRIKILQAAARKEGMDLTILPGAEVTVSPEMHAHLAPESLLTINGGRYFLVEFRPLSVPSRWDTFLLSFLASGMTPIIAHPERNAWFMNHPEALSSAVQSGILVQITAASITGGFGEEARDFCIHLLRRNLVHAIASDGHSADLRPPRLAEAASLAAEVVGEERARALVTSIPQAIILGRRIPVLQPLTSCPPCDVRKSGWFQRLRTLSQARM